jgi:hypothetical protein
MTFSEIKKSTILVNSTFHMHISCDFIWMLGGGDLGQLTSSCLFSFFSTVDASSREPPALTMLTDTQPGGYQDSGSLRENRP